MLSLEVGLCLLLLIARHGKYLPIYFYFVKVKVQIHKHTLLALYYPKDEKQP